MDGFYAVISTFRLIVSLQYTQGTIRLRIDMVPESVFAYFGNQGLTRALLLLHLEDYLF
jgi:hypothetical protein